MPVAYVFGSTARHEPSARDVDLQFRVIDEGSPIHVRDDAARVRREVRVMGDYYDFRPYLDRIRAGARARWATDTSRGRGPVPS